MERSRHQRVLGAQTFSVSTYGALQLLVGLKCRRNEKAERVSVEQLKESRKETAACGCVCVCVRSQASSCSMFADSSHPSW